MGQPNVDGRTEANLGLLQANLGLLQANLGLLKANLELLQANLGLLQANLGLLQANLELLQANLGLLQANLGLLQANLELLQANLGLLQANLELLKAYLELLQANLGLLQAANSDETDVADVPPPTNARTEHTVVPSRDDIVSDMLSVFCNTSAMSVRYKVAGAWQATLTDPSCSVGFVNNTYFITTAFYTCSTTRTETTRTTSFVNQLLFRSLNSGVTRRFTRSVTCTFPRSPLVYRSIGVLSYGHPLHRNTTVWMDIYKGSERMSVYPVSVDYSNSFTILFTTSDPRWAPYLQPRDCFIAPSKEDRKRFPLITNTCPHSTVNMTRTKRGIYMFVTPRYNLTSATKAHIFCTVGRCNPRSCRPCQVQHSLPLNQLLELQQGPFIMTPSAGLKLLSSTTQSTSHFTVSSTSSVSSSSLTSTNKELRTGVTEGKPVTTEDSLNGHHPRPNGENRNAEVDAKESPPGVTLNPNWTSSHSVRSSDTSRTPSLPVRSSDSNRTPSHPSESAEVPMEIPIPRSESGVLEMPSQNETSNVSGTLSTGTAVGVGVGVVMVSVMAITLAIMKYGPGVKIFKRGSGRNP
ncbi:uncharacterized protein LOC124291552 [Haliotis rubra]|uniref:uncharacterized protein LOC124291552 n=1 Tax=Haliotis rubra TaxID=36100 RepID=UPI001EE55B98|nr:uncharacterized protein LOC124291552 [Haliotis rubra]